MTPPTELTSTVTARHDPRARADARRLDRLATIDPVTTRPSSSASAGSILVAANQPDGDYERDLRRHRQLSVTPPIEAAGGGCYGGCRMQSAPRNHPRHNARVACDGSGEIAAALGHPARLPAHRAERGFVECGYCDRRFVLDGGPADTQAHDRADPRRFLYRDGGSIPTRPGASPQRHLDRLRRRRALPPI